MRNLRSIISDKIHQLPSPLLVFGRDRVRVFCWKLYSAEHQQRLRAFFTVLSILVLLLFSCSCNSRPNVPDPSPAVNITDSVRMLTDAIAASVSAEGPTAWIKWFEHSNDFYMASEGQVVFPNYDSAERFIQLTLVKEIRTIKLNWKDLRIDSISPTTAGIAAVYHEELSNFSGKKILEDGYFTAIARQTNQGWKLRSAHWSVLPKK